MSSPASPALFQPAKIGDITLNHRVVLAPLTRYKSRKPDHVPVTPLMKEYYSQRSRVPGSFLITEATFIAAKAGGYHNIPGIWSQEQVSAWKEVVDGVHANGSYIFLQLWALGRTSFPDELKADDPSFDLVGPSAIPVDSQKSIPRPLTIPEIEEYVQLYGQAAKNASEAGFDGVEIHGANGYLVDQFLQDVTNQRTDAYGGSIENRSRFGLEVIDAVVKAVGAGRTGIRLSPWSPFQGMRMEDPVPQFSHFVTSLKTKYPDLAYLHLVEPRINGSTEAHISTPHESNDFIREIWGPRPLISAGGHSRESALQCAEEKGGLVAFGRFYISNPDLPTRLKENIPLTPYNRKTFYTRGDQAGAEVGYIDYPFANAKDMSAL
ncbi:hypothetical protein BDZ94DRAFT_1260391 [Collybia nuda]|uniref:NADH:flavin oxidoreductase/NADH oxidase N-terminal domain-containing protein n=1 Tax=Collybia nuda TaxID=64659 RepID=A0A9P5Y513_9AGAR|nr:hypothetical protein BDZ94DRAFT_1260391 [Collybia nuda]